MPFKGTLTVTVGSNQHCEHQHGDQLERLLNRSTHGFVKASVEASLIVAYKLALERYNSGSISASNIHNSNNNSLAFYNAG